MILLKVIQIVFNKLTSLNKKRILCEIEPVVYKFIFYITKKYINGR